MVRDKWGLVAFLKAFCFYVVESRTEKIKSVFSYSWAFDWRMHNHLSSIEMLYKNDLLA